MFRYYGITLCRCNTNVLYATTLWGTTAVVWQRCNVDNLDDFDTSTMTGTDSALTTVTGPLHVCLYLAQTEVESNLSAILSGHLRSIRCVLLRTAEAHLTG